MNQDLQSRVLSRLGVRPAVDRAGLSELYGAWCERVPFDNIRKLIALGRRDDPPLPGLAPEEFFEAWLAHGTGGTCWPSGRALLSLFRGCGFEAKPAAASMRDLGPRNHGTVVVRQDGADWLVDSSFLTNRPLPLGEGLFVLDDSGARFEIEKEHDGHVLWASTPPRPHFYPCRVFSERPAADLWEKGYEESRLKSPFNERIYARRNRKGGTLLLFGSALHVRSVDGVVSRELSRAQLLEVLRREFGYSETIVGEWIEVGGLEASMKPAEGPPPPSPDRLRPTER